MTVTPIPGDSITYPCDVPHRISNRSDGIAIANWLIVHPTAGGL